MKKIIIILALITVFQIQDTRVNNFYDDVKYLNELAIDLNMDVQEWQDVYIEKINRSSFEEMKKILKKDHRMNSQITENSDTYIFTPDKKNQSIQYEIRAVNGKARNQTTTIHIVFNGVNWDEGTERAYASVLKKLQDNFNFQLSTSFACAKMNINDMIDDGYMLKKVMEKVQAIHIDEQEDNIENSTYEKNIYGNSAHLNHTIAVEGKQINLQAAVRKITNQKKQVILGTPLILNEY